MNVIIIGGGVVGVTTAYYLSEAGINVTVLEKREDGGLETSFGNAGFISPSDAFAWASPSTLKFAVKSLVNPELSIRINKKVDPSMWRWSMSFLGQCTHQQWARNSDIKYHLAAYSMKNLNVLRHQTGVDFNASDNGIAYLSRSKQSLQELSQHFNFLQDRGLQLELLNRSALLEKIPVLKDNPGSYAGAVYSPTCKTGDSAKFTRSLANWCEKNGKCKFEWNTSVEIISSKGGRITGIKTSKGDYKADAYVLAAGAYSGILAKQLGIRIPIYPIKGFSITAPIINSELAPDLGFDDVDRMVAVSRLGDKLRMSSSAVFDSFNKNHNPNDFKSVLKLAREVFPGVADYDKAEYWAGLRPMTPSSVPILGATPLQNLYLNAGHGHLGWTLACGTAKLVADSVLRQQPELDMRPFQLKI